MLSVHSFFVISVPPVLPVPSSYVKDEHTKKRAARQSGAAAPLIFNVYIDYSLATPVFLAASATDAATALPTLGSNAFGMI